MSRAKKLQKKYIHPDLTEWVEKNGYDHWADIQKDFPEFPSATLKSMWYYGRRPHPAMWSAIRLKDELKQALLQNQQLQERIDELEQALKIFLKIKE
jgi:hypothetical protein